MIQEHQIYGITYKTPEVPKKLPKGNKFYKIEIPDSFNELEFDDDGSPVYSDEQVDFIQNEFNKILNGYWFSNNDIPTYINGLHYFYLNYWTLEDGNTPDYRDVDRRYFYYQEYCEKHIASIYTLALACTHLHMSKLINPLSKHSSYERCASPYCINLHTCAEIAMLQPCLICGYLMDLIFGHPWFVQIIDASSRVVFFSVFNYLLGSFLFFICHLSPYLVII